MKKICMKCGKELDVSKFPVRGTKKDGTPSYRSCCTSCWNSIRRARYNGVSPDEVEVKDENTELLIKALAEFVSFSTDELSACTKEDFISYTGYTEPFSFTDLKAKTFEYLDSIGVGNPSSITLNDDGNYLIVGDTYGQHTRSGMFMLLNNICKAYSVRAIVFVGKQTDENDTISNCFANFSVPVIFVASPEEITTIHNYSKEIGASVVRDFVKIGLTTVCNQEQISPYVKKSISSLDSLLFSGNHIVNCTRMEYAVRNMGSITQYIASPGAVAEPFVPKLRNKLLIKGGLRVAQVFSHSFKKYRKAEEDKRLWEQGCILAMKTGSIVQCGFLPIKKINGVYTSAFAGCVCDESKFTQTAVSVVVSDIHAPYISKKSMDAFLHYIALNEEFINQVVCAGDIIDCRSVNPHILSKGELPEETFSDTLFAMDSVLYNIKDAVGDVPVTLMLGNHSDFLSRWTNKNPQFKEFLKDSLYSIASNYTDEIIDTDDFAYVSENTVVVHGNSFVSNSGSTNTEKYARAFNHADAVVIGHSHSTNVRMGCIRIGCLCEFDQGYNSPYGAWDHSFAVITSVSGVDFVSPLFITNGYLMDGFETIKGIEDCMYEPTTELTITLRRN